MVTDKWFGRIWGPRRTEPDRAGEAQCCGRSTKSPLYAAGLRWSTVGPGGEPEWRRIATDKNVLLSPTQD
jgi:hypothetical protein